MQKNIIWSNTRCTAWWKRIGYVWYTNKSLFGIFASKYALTSLLCLLISDIVSWVTHAWHRNIEIVRSQPDPQYFRRTHQSVKNTVPCAFVMNGLISCCKVQTIEIIQSFDWTRKSDNTKFMEFHWNNKRKVSIVGSVPGTRGRF